jgi:DNA polymerase I-like protein with 3'-5' exonuclease and polymerase domains
MAKFNMQQQPKTPGYLSALKARPGHKLVQFDLAAIEPRIVTEFSRDPTMMNLYGPNAKQNDIYLYNGAHISLFSDEIRKTYDPANPTPESIAATKKRCKRLRDFNKSITLASGYGCGVHKLRSILITGGFPVTEAEAKQIHTDYWKLYAGIKVFGAELECLWAANGGWFPNVSGRPICVPFDLLHDSVNRFAQSSGHDVLVFFIGHTQRLRQERGVEMYPWIVDFHDEQIWEVPEAQVDAAKQVMIDALTAVNAELAMGVQITGEPEVVDNLAEIKCLDDYRVWKEAHATL